MRRAAPEASAGCVLPAATEAIAVERPRDAELHEYFVLKDGAQWWAPAPEDEERAAYRAALSERLGGAGQLQPRALLERQKAMHAGLGGDRAREAENADVLLAGHGTIGPASGDRQSKRLFDCQQNSAPPASVDRTSRMRSHSRDDIPANSIG